MIKRALQSAVKIRFTISGIVLDHVGSNLFRKRDEIFIAFLYRKSQKIKGYLDRKLRKYLNNNFVTLVLRSFT